MTRWILLACVSVLLLCGACSRPDVKVPHVNPVETVPRKAEPVKEPPAEGGTPATGNTHQAAPPEGGAVEVSAPPPTAKAKAPESQAQGPTSAGEAPTPSPESPGQVPVPASTPKVREAAPLPLPPAESVPPEEKPAAAKVYDPIATIRQKVLDAVIRARPQAQVAVFPALSPSPATKAVRTSRLGDEIAERIAASLRERLEGVDVPGPSALRTLINEVGNRGLADILSPGDVFTLADRIGADLCVAGTIEAVVDKRYRTLQELTFRFEVREVPTGRTVAVVTESLPGTSTTARLLREKYEAGGRWRVGLYAEPFDISLDKELNYIVIRALSSLLIQARSVIRGHRVAVAPVRTEGYRDLEADDFLRAFNEEWASLAKQVNPFFGGDPRERALDGTPVTVLGKRFRSLREARDHLRVLQRQAKLSVSARLSQEMTELLYEELLAQAGGDFTVSLSVPDRREIEDFINREYRLYQETGGIDPESISQLRTKGAEYLLVSRFRQEGPSYVLDAFIVNMKTGARVTRRLRFAADPRLTEEINKRF